MKFRCHGVGNNRGNKVTGDDSGQVAADHPFLVLHGPRCVPHFILFSLHSQYFVYYCEWKCKSEGCPNNTYSTPPFCNFCPMSQFSFGNFPHCVYDKRKIKCKTVIIIIAVNPKLPVSEDWCMICPGPACVYSHNLLQSPILKTKCMLHNVN